LIKKPGCGVGCSLVITGSLLACRSLKPVSELVCHVTRAFLHGLRAIGNRSLSGAIGSLLKRIHDSLRGVPVCNLTPECIEIHAGLLLHFLKEWLHGIPCGPLHEILGLCVLEVMPNVCGRG